MIYVMMIFCLAFALPIQLFITSIWKFRTNIFFIIDWHSWWWTALLICVGFPCSGFTCQPFVEASPSGHGGPYGHYWCADGSALPWPCTTSHPWGPERGGTYSCGPKQYWGPKHEHSSDRISLSSAYCHPSGCPYPPSLSIHPTSIP